MKKRRAGIIALAVCAACMIVFAVCCAVYNKTAHTLSSQYAAQRWRGDNEMRYAQVSVFRSGDEAMSYGDIYTIRNGIKDALISVSIDPGENENITRDAYCAESSVTVSSQRARNVQTTLYAIGGDYFFFHPLKLDAGGYISEQDLSRDLAVLDRELSWSLFGSVDSVGLTFTMGDKEYIVAGVVSRDNDRFSKKTDEAISCMFALYPAVYDTEQRAITCYEAVTPDPVENFALNTLEELSPSGEKVENSRRFTVGKISKLVLSFGSRAISTSGIIYPHWELAARLCEDHLAVAAVIAALMLVLPVICALIAIVLAYKALRKTGKRMVTKMRGR